jgi:transposase
MDWESNTAKEEKMNRTIVAQDSEVVIGVDVHTDSHVVAVKAGKDIVDRISMKGRREEWGRYLKRFPGCVLHVVYESGPNGYNLHDLLMELDGEDGREVHVHVAPPSMLPQAPGRSRVKTDRRDAVKLIQAFESGCFRPVVVPDARRRACRQLVRERERIKKDVKRIKNRIHGLVKFHGLEYPQSQRWDAAWREGLTSQARRKDASGHVLFVLRTEFRLLDANLGLQAATEKQLARMFRTGAEKELYRKLTRQTGIGPVTAAVIATEVADFHAFDNSDAFASYTGLVSGARGTGKVMHLGPITKVGNRRLRWAFVESAWTWVRCDQAAKTRFELLKARRGARRAIVAMARRLAVLVYHQVVNDAPVATLSFRD